MLTKSNKGLLHSKCVTKKRVRYFGGSGKINNKILQQTIIKNINTDPGLLANITRDLGNPRATTLESLQQAYSTNYTGKQLYDLIYLAGAQTNKQPPAIKKKVLTQPGLIWDHGINQSHTITAGLPGLHIYILLDVARNKYDLLGIFLRRPMPNK